MFSFRADVGPGVPFSSIIVDQAVGFLSRSRRFLDFSFGGHPSPMLLGS